MPGTVVGGRLQARDGIPPGAVVDELLSAEEIGLHVVGLHPGIQFLDVVIGLHGGLVVTVRQGGHRHVTVDLVPLLEGVVALHVVVEGRHVAVQVEGQFRIVEIGVLLDVLVIPEGGGILESLHGRHLVAQLDVTVAHLVVGDLAQGVRTLGHLVEAVHSPLPVLHAVQEGTGIEVVRPVADGLVLQILLVIGTGSLRIPEDEVGFAHDAGEMGLPVRRDLVEQVLAELHDIVVVLLHEAALEDVVVRELREAGVGSGLREPVGRLAEIALGVAHVAQGILGGCGIVGIRKPLHLLELHPGEGEVAGAEGAVSLLVHVFRNLSGEKLILRDAVETIGGVPVETAVEQVLSPAEIHLRDERGFGPAVQEGLRKLLIAGSLLFDGAEGGVALGLAAGKGGEKPGGLGVHAAFVQVHGPAVLGRLGRCCGHEEGGRGGQYDSFVHRQIHYFTNLRIFLIIFVLNSPKTPWNPSSDSAAPTSSTERMSSSTAWTWPSTRATSSIS